MLHPDIIAGLKQKIREIFDLSPIESQPDCIAGTGGDAALLLELHATVSEDTARGQCLDRHPLALVEVGLPDAPGCEGPGRNVLQIRFCMDHLLEIDTDGPVDEALAVLLGPPSHPDGQACPPTALAVLSGWQAHLRAIAEGLGQSRLLTAQVHVGTWEEEGCDAPEGIGRPAQGEPVGAEAFIVLAARAGLFNDGPALRLPPTSAPCQASLHSLTRRDYIVRHAASGDLERLCELEKLCWPHTRASKQRIRARLRDYPQGQFVLEKDGTVLGVVFSQRIASADLLDSCTAADVHRLHDPTGPVIQLLAVNIDPQAQNLRYGDQLLEFMLQRCALVTGVERVVGVTLCKSFSASDGRPFDRYIHEQGAGQDPVLAFHRAHGADVVKAIPGYRPRDRANLGHGVLVAYDILRRMPRRQRPQAKVGAVARYAGHLPVHDYVETQVARLLGVGRSEVDSDRPLMEMGLDSADLLQLQQLVEEEFRLDLEPGFFFHHSTVGRVAEHLATRLGVAAEAPATAPFAPAEQADGPPRDQGTGGCTLEGAVAIIGMACRLPGGIETPDQLWHALLSGDSVVGPYPAARGAWPDGRDRPGIDRGGFIRDVEAFDAAFFRISPAEALITDPQQRMLLELAWACVEDAGVLPTALQGTGTGVFIGASNCDYSRLIQDTGLEVQAHHGVASSLAVLANRISYFLDLSGPSMLIDTACSSSLVALHAAVQSLRSGECAAAFVGGVNLICHPDLSVAYHKAGMLSADGRCKTFDAGADGYVRSEGAAVLLLKPLRTAIADRDPIHAVIRGGATNHGGLAGGLTVPNPQKQSELLAAAWRDARIEAQDLGYLEAHGTGTPLGDPIEVQGMQAACARFGPPPPGHVCAIGSVKSNLGHLESAAGIAGVLKVVLSMQHRQLPASINFERLNPKIRLDGTPLRIQERHGDWHGGGPRIAGVSSFGSGGTNAHVVLQEHPCDAVPSCSAGDCLFVLSAADEDRLRVYAACVVDWIDSGASGDRFADAIYSWQIGRTAMKHRLAIRVASFAQLRAKLGDWLSGGTDVPDLWLGRAGVGDPSLHRTWATKTGKRLIEQALRERELEQLGILWVSGIEIDWSRLYGEHEPRRLRLPTYPFARERYWIDQARRARPEAAAPVAAPFFLHPLLHANTSDLSRQRYDSVFDGEEFFLADHRVSINGRAAARILPAAVYLEMARAAIELALPGDRGDRTLDMRNTLWMRPIVVTGRAHVAVELVSNDGERIDYRIYSEADEEIVHCEGYALVESPVPAAAHDLTQIEARMEHGFSQDSLYAAFARMGLHYGPAHRALTALSIGKDELLARLRLPAVLEPDRAHYTLHPSLIDGALQAAFGLLVDLNAPPEQPSLPFALETLRILAPCPPETQAWVRYAPGRGSSDAGAMLDIDLCDAQGNICVQMHGFSSRAPAKDGLQAAAQHGSIGALLASQVWTPGDAATTEADQSDYAEHLLILCELPQIDPEKLASSLSRTQGVALQADASRTLAERYSEYALACFERVRMLLHSKLEGQALVQVVVPDQGEQAVFAGLSGLLKTAALENPRVVGQLVLVPPHTTTPVLARQLQAERSRTHDTLVRYTPDGRQVAGWQEVVTGESAPSLVFQERGVYLITGGMGGLGRLFAQEILIRTPAAKVVLTGRSALSAAQRTLLEGLSGSADRVSYRQMDPGHAGQVQELVAAIREEHGQLNGILHSAGMIADNFILKKTVAEFGEVLAPKVRGTFHLDEATADIKLDFLVLFSSIASVLGNLGQADYAVANGFMDRYAEYRNQQVAAGRRYGRTLSINWPLWDAGGMTLDATSLAWLERTIGLHPMHTEVGLAAFHRCLALRGSQALVLEGELARLRRTLFQAPVVPVAPQAAEQTGVSRPIAAAGAESLAGKAQDYLRQEFSGLLKLPAHKLDSQAALEAYGIDSILAMQLTERLEQSFGPLPKTLFFEYQTIRELAGYLVAQHAGRLHALLAPERNEGAATPPVPPAPAGSAPRRRVLQTRAARAAAVASDDPIAIVGLSGRYPEAVDIDAYWRNLRDGRDCIIEVPKERWDWREYFSEDRNEEGRHYSKWGGFIAGVDEFDPLFFNISPREAKALDPQERLFLQHAWMAIEDAGYTRATLQMPDEQDLAGQVGVYVGLMYTEYQLFGTAVDPRELKMGFAGIPASIANRVSHVLNLHGPSMTLDTMCSSSLTAIHLACQDLKQGRTQLAIAGGVNVSIHPNKYLVLSAGQFISSDGHCQSFGEGGDGYIPAEGVGVVVLKRLSLAQRDGDHIYGLIRGSAINHGGKTNGYTVPNPRAQAAAIGRTLTEAGVDARHVSYVEAHGTGTKLGDPIEIAALAKAFQSYTSETGFCLIGSAKSNIGHCESAAGIAGLTKVLLQLQHRQIVPSLHSAQLNPHIDFDSSPFVVNQALRAWDAPVIDGRTLPRIAGISSFGAGGSNAHLVVAEYQPPDAPPVVHAQTAVLLSARTAEQLQHKARDLLAFVRDRGAEVDLTAMAYTLQVGREAMEERLGLVVGSLGELTQKLQAWIEGEPGCEGCHRGQVKPNREALSLFDSDAGLKRTVENWLVDRQLSKLLELWAKGLEVEWARLYEGEARPKRISLPTYPFAKDRYWLDDGPGQSRTAIAGPSSAAAVLHPLLHSNTSTLNEHRYRTTFSGDESFLIDPVEPGAGQRVRKMLPVAAYFEMARAAIAQAMPEWSDAALELRDTAWEQPVVVSRSMPVDIALSPNGDDCVDFEIFSGTDEEEIIHCQGRAVSGRTAPAPRLDLEHLRVIADRDPHQVLAELRLRKPGGPAVGDYVLHPGLVDDAMQVAATLVSDGSGALLLPVSLQALRIVAPCMGEMLAWVRHSSGGRASGEAIVLDIDLCDMQGNVCVQMHGVALRQAAAVQAGTVHAQRVATPASDGTSAHVAAPSLPPTVAAAAPVPKPIAFLSPNPATPPAAQPGKAAAIALSSPGAPLARPTVALQAPTGLASARVARAPIALAPVALAPTSAYAPITADIASAVELHDGGNGVFSCRIATPDGDNVLTEEVIDHLLLALDRVRREPSLKVLIIEGTARGFLRGGRTMCDAAIARGLYSAIIAFPCPVIAVAQGDALGAGFLLAALCDLMVCSEAASYGFTDPETGCHPTAAETALFAERFGSARAQDLLYAAATATGEQWRRKGWTCPIVPDAQVQAQAQALASALATKPELALRLLKQHLARFLTDRVAALAPVGEAPAEPVRKDTARLTSPSKRVRVQGTDDGVLQIRLRVAGKPAGAKTLLADLGRLFARLREGSPYRAVVLSSDRPEFFPGPALSEEAAMGFHRMLAESPVPVVMALEGGVQGRAWLLSQCCEACVYNADAAYTADGVGRGALAQLASALFMHRFGSAAGREILLTGAVYSGASLQGRTCGLTAVAQDQVLATATALARHWASLPRTALAAWKEWSAMAIQAQTRAVPPGGEESGDAAGALQLAEPTPIALQSTVVSAVANPDGVVVVKMEDRQAKNMFSDAFMAGVAEAFAHIERTPGYKVVVLTGYDSYFSSGGTKDSLLAIQGGQVRFTDYRKTFEAARTCRLPVIAAMQGHGIGAGWTLGMFADVVLLAGESQYASPYMNYGFTPGAGATWVLADRIGEDLSRESLLTAQFATGSQLQARGVRLPVLPRSEVVGAALALAREMARADRGELIERKRQLTAYADAAVEETYRLELALHEHTFVGRAQTLVQIEREFRDHGEVAPAAPAADTPAPPARPMPDGNLETLRTLLAHALLLPEHEIDADAQFVDLGLDSISGVTWIRRINERFGIAIEATKVYSYPTLTRLSRYVQEEVHKRSGPPPVVPEPAAVPAPMVATAPAESRERSRHVAAHLKALLAHELHLQERDIEEHVQFADLGLDSISGVTWVRKINEYYGTSIEATKVYQYPTLAQLSRYVEEEAGGSGALPDAMPSLAAPEPVISRPAAPSRERGAVEPRTGGLTSRRARTLSKPASRIDGTQAVQPIAVIGMAGQFPHARNVDEFWCNIAEGRDCISEVSRERWDVDEYYRAGDPVPGKSNSKWAGALEDYDRFDPLFFNISPTEAEHMDPQQRLFLQSCWQGIEDAGCNAQSLSGSKCGVFVGCAGGDYHQLSREHQLSAQGFTGSATSILAARISYHLNLQGPCISIDTACSSSLVAMAYACDSLIGGTSDLALAGGVHVMAGPDLHIKASQAGMLSPGGRCSTFDQRADGFVPGEGVGVVLLKRLADAERDRDIIHAVIHGWGVNQDGKTNGITAPNPESQSRLEQEVYDRFRIDPAGIQLVEAHGTGTKLGDPIEVEALQQAFKKYTQQQDYCALGSVKSNIGHCATAAGIAGAIKLVLALKHGQLPPTINYQGLSEHIALEGSPFYVNDRLKPWDPGNARRRLAVVSSFGFSGTNAHMVLGEYLAPAQAGLPVSVVTQDGSVIVPLSARTVERLRDKAGDLLRFLRRESPQVDLVELAYTLQVGREPMEERLGFLAATPEQLIEQLQAYVDGAASIERCCQGRAMQGKESLSILLGQDELHDAVVEKCIGNRKLSRLLDLWVKGLDFDWNRLYGDVKPRRISLPTYPFARERYWLDPSKPAHVTMNDRAATMLHPLLHANTSDLREQRYSSTFGGDEFFLADHRVRMAGSDSRRVLPGVAYLEMARAAIAQAMPAHRLPGDPQSAMLELRNIVWAQPLVVDGQTRIHISLSEGDGNGIDYEIYSGDGGQNVLHAQGGAAFVDMQVPVRLDLDAMQRRMDRDALEPEAIYAAFARMNLHYGPAHRAIATLHAGEREALAWLRLPSAIAQRHGDYVLHPSLLDGALQASLGVIFDLDRLPDKPSLPFALDALQVLAPCTTEMAAWVRPAPGISLADRVVKLDIDLCDTQGVVCAKLCGLALRFFERDQKTVAGTGSLAPATAVDPSFDRAYYERLVEDIARHRVSVDDAVELE